MVKIILVSLWAVLATLGSFYGVMVWRAGAEAKVAPKELFSTLEQGKTEVVSVPMISNGEVQGYVLARFAYFVDGEKLKEMSIKPDVILVDEAFRLIYSSPVRDFQRIEKYDLASLTRRLKENVNKRLGMKLVHDVLVDSINYVARSEIRYRGLKQ